MSIVKSFPPLLAPRPKVLVLGSIPGGESLRRGEYYAHPRNAFWPIMGEICGFDPSRMPYQERCRQLGEIGIAVWDMLESCQRKGSLDSAIASDSERPNNIRGLLQTQPSIRAVCCNGHKALSLFHQHVGEIPGGTKVLRLPSSSPANARMRLQEKLVAWRAVIEPHLDQIHHRSA